MLKTEALIRGARNKQLLGASSRTVVLEVRAEIPLSLYEDQKDP